MENILFVKISFVIPTRSTPVDLNRSLTSKMATFTGTIHSVRSFSHDPLAFSSMVKCIVGNEC